VTLVGLEFLGTSGDTISFGGTANGSQIYMVDCGVSASGASASDAVDVNAVTGGPTPGIIADNSVFRVLSGATGVAVNMQSGTFQGRGNTINALNSSSISVNLGPAGRAWTRDTDFNGRVVVGNTAPAATSAVFEARHSQFRANTSSVIDNSPGRILITDSILGAIAPADWFAGDAFTNDSNGAVWYGGLNFAAGNSLTIPSGSTNIGTAGPAGPQGPQGLQGLQGIPGIQGPIGMTGPAGADGAPGAQGIQGIPGPAGAAGATGPAGVVAATAPINYNGGTQTVGLDALGVTGAFIATNAVDTSKIADDAVTSVKIATGSVMSSDIADGTINQVDMNTNAVATSTIQDGAVTAVKLASNSVDSGKIVDGSIATADIGDSQVTAAKIANRVRTMSITGSQFIGQTSTSAFNWSSGNRGIVPRSFGSANSAGQMYVAFQVPNDYVGPSAADLSANPGIVAPRLRIKWVTDSTDADRRINMDVSWAQETDLNGGNLTRFRYNVRAGGTGSDASDSANPTNVQVATQIVPEPGDNWSSGEGAPIAWAPGQTIYLTLARNTTDDPNSQRVGIITVSFEYDADQ
jgi:hypothetical protein